MKAFRYILFFTSLLLQACQPGSIQDDKKTRENADSPGLSAQQCITPVYIPPVVTFAGDTIPLNRTDVKEALEAELMVNTFRHSHTLSVIKNVERWRPLVTRILQDNSIPQDFLYLAVIESEFDNNARSYAGAMGMWQIMEKTAKDYKLKINKDVDMRRDPKLSTIAACSFLKWANNQLGNWILTAASYNMGVRGIKDRLEEQKVETFFDLHLNSETGRYVYRILAMKLILENPKAYGYHVPDEEKYEPYRFETVTVCQDIDNLVDFAKQYNSTYKELRILNPWLNNASSFKLHIGRKDSFEIRVPVQLKTPTPIP